MKQETKQKIVEIIWLFLFGIIMILIGFLIGFYIGYDYEGEVLDGVQTSNFIGYWKAIPVGEDVENWISIKVDGMSIKQMNRICNHEIGHEIYYRNTKKYDNNESEEFAELCEENISKCLEEIK